MASLKYGCITPHPVIKELPVAASQYFYHNGVNAVYLDRSGHVTLGLTATATLYGFAVVPKGMGAGTSANYWLSSATAGKDKIGVITVADNPSAKFLLPNDTTATAAMLGNACDLVAVNDGTATYVNSSASSTDVFLVEDYGSNPTINAAATDIVVRINPAKVQANT